MPKKKNLGRGYSTVSIPKPKQKQSNTEEIFNTTETIMEKIPEKVQPTPTDYSMLSLSKKIASNFLSESKHQSILAIQLTIEQEDAMLQVPNVTEKKWTFKTLILNYYRMLNLGLDQSTIFTILGSIKSFDLESLLLEICLKMDIKDLPIHWHDKIISTPIEYLDTSIAKVDLSQAEENLIESAKSNQEPSILNEREASNSAILENCDTISDLVVELQEEENLVESTISNQGPKVLDQREAAKRWILENYSTISDSESITQESEISLSELTNDYIATFQMFSRAKIENNKEEKKEFGKYLSKLRQQLVANQINPDDILIDRKILNPVIETENEEENLFDLGVFEMETTRNESKNEELDILDLTYSAWTGRSPCCLLEELYKKKDSSATFHYQVKQTHSRGYQTILTIKRKKQDLFKFNTPENVVVGSKEQSKDYIACVALFKLYSKLQLSKNLPEPFLKLWNSWIEQEINEKTVLDHKESEHLYVFLNNCFQNNLHPSVKLKVAAVTNHEILKNSIISRPYIQSRNSWLQRLGSLKVQEIRKQTELLPAFRYFDTIVSTIMINPITIICGMTGSGKSTQIPKYLLENSIENNQPFRLLCSQPRRISAISLANRVSYEMGDEIGNQWVGYQVKNDTKICKQTCIQYATTGILLQMLVSDPLLSGFTHILIDEVHERTIESDFLLLLVKKLIIKRPSLRVVLMSATADARHFVDYFESALETVPVVDISGKLFPVKQVYLHEIIELTDYKLKYDSEYRMKDNQIHQKLANVKVSEKRGRSQTLKYEWNEATKFVNESIEPSEIVTSI